MKSITRESVYYLLDDKTVGKWHQRAIKILSWQKMLYVKRKNERRKFLIDADRKQVLDPW